MRVLSMPLLLISGLAFSQVERIPLGDYLVELDQQASTLAIYNSDNTEIASSVSGRSLVEIGKATDKVKNNRASFSFNEKITQSCRIANFKQVEVEVNSITIEGDFSDCSEAGFSLRLEENQGLLFKVSASSNEYNRVALRLASTPNEDFYGFGEQYFSESAKGKLIPIWLQEQGHGRGLQPLTAGMSLVAAGASVGNETSTYSAVPSFITSQSRGMSLENFEYLSFDLRDKDELFIRVWSSKLEGRLFQADTPLKLLTKMSDYAGRMQPLPSWTQEGLILRVAGGENKVLESIERARKAGIKLAAVWVEDWVGKRSTLLGERLWWNWQANPDYYPNWPEFVQKIKSQGIRVLIYFNPYISDPKDASFEVTRNLFEEAVEQDWFVRDSSSKYFEVKAGLFGGNIIDLTNPAARAFYKQLMKDQLRLGVSGWMADFGEAIPYDAELFDGSKGSHYHNQFAMEWSKLTFEAISEMGMQDEAFSFHRSGTLKSPQYNTMFWTGDQLTNWDSFDGIATVIPALTSSGMSGWSLSHSDIGGFLGIDILFLKYKRSQELLLRWLELNTFTSLLRTHASNRPDLSSQWDDSEQTMRAFSKMVDVFSLMKDYRASLFKEAYEQGYPVVRHMFLEFPMDQIARKSFDQFMLGSDFLIAPVLEKAANSRQVYLPKGAWRHLWSDRAYDSDGAYFEVLAPLGEPPVFFKADSQWGKKLKIDINQRF